MNIERISPIGDDKDKKTGKASSPDSEAFKEMMKIGKTREVDIDERSKRRLPRHEEEEDAEEQTTTQPSASDVYYYKEEEAKPVSDDLPSSHTLLDANAKKIDPKNKAKMIATLESEIKKEKKEGAKILEEPPVIVKKAKEKKPPLSPTIKTEASEKKPSLKTPTAKIPSAFVPSEAGEKIKEAALPIKGVKKEEKKEIKKPEVQREELHEKAKAKKEKPILTEEKPLSTTTFVLPQNIITQTQNIVAQTPAAINPEIVPVMEYMIGVIMFSEQKGISTTTIILDNPSFSASRFYGTKITLEKYSTNPNSYNIILTGSQEAVTIFNDNLEGLYKFLKNADLDFEVGRISAEYQDTKPLFKRKPGAANLGKEEDNG